VCCPVNVFPHAERSADSETGTGFLLKRESVRDSATSFALLTSLRMTLVPHFVKLFAGHHTSDTQPSLILELSADRSSLKTGCKRDGPTLLWRSVPCKPTTQANDHQCITIPTDSKPDAGGRSKGRGVYVGLRVSATKWGAASACGNKNRVVFEMPTHRDPNEQYYQRRILSDFLHLRSSNSSLSSVAAFVRSHRSTYADESYRHQEVAGRLRLFPIVCHKVLCRTLNTGQLLLVKCRAAPSGPRRAANTAEDDR
jgi:hypothetical protein